MKKTTEKKQKYTEFELDKLFTKKEEINAGRQILAKYLSDYEIESLSDRNLLRQLVYLEVINSRLQATINGFDEVNNAAPYQLIDTLHKNLSKVVDLREKLGLNKDKKDKENDYSILKKLQKKFKIWADNNRGSRTAVCPHCSQLLLFKIRMDGYLASKHPYFKDRWIFNPALFDLYKSGKITKADVANVLQVATDYVDWIETKLCKPAKAEELMSDNSTNVGSSMDNEVGHKLEVKTEEEVAKEPQN